MPESNSPESPSSAERYQPGYVVDETYLLKNLLGKGGMGSVFRAEHLLMHKEYALKFLAVENISETNWQRFTQEARAIAKMDHPGIVKIHNMGVDPFGVPYYVMDLLSGITLSDLCTATSKTSIIEIIAIFIKIADGLSYAHKKGFIHRDIKPSNIVLVTEQDNVSVKIVDFGIAKLITDDTGAQSLTKTGEVFGSPLYMSPEQCLGNSSDQRSDIYSLGCTLFEVLTKRTPYRGRTALETLSMHQSAPVPNLNDFLPESAITKALDAILARMLAKDPDDRYQCMNDLIEDLKDAESESGNQDLISVPSKTREYKAHLTKPKKKIWIAPIAALTVIMVIPVVIVLIAPHQKNEAPVKTAMLDPDNPEELLSIDNAHAIKSRLIQTETGLKREIIFPKTTIGTYFDADNPRPETACEASGKQLIAPDMRLGLAISPKEDYVAFFHPEVYSKIGSTELTTLDLQLLPNDQLGQLPEKHRNQQTRCVLKILETACTWTKLDCLDLKNFSVGETDSLEVFNKLTNIRTLHIYGQLNLDGKKFGATRIFDKLHTLAIGHWSKLDSLIESITWHNELHIIHLEVDDITSDTMRHLAKFPRLQVVMLYDGKSISEEKLDWLISLPYLIELDMINCPMTLSQIQNLCTQKPRLVLYLHKKEYEKTPKMLNLLKQNKQIRLR